MVLRPPRKRQVQRLLLTPGEVVGHGLGMTRGLRRLTCHPLSGNHEPANEMNPDWQPYTPRMRLSNLHMLDSKFKVGCRMHPKPSFHTHTNREIYQHFEINLRLSPWDTEHFDIDLRSSPLSEFFEFTHVPVSLPQYSHPCLFHTPSQQSFHKASLPHHTKGCCLHHRYCQLKNSDLGLTFQAPEHSNRTSL